MVCGLVLLEWTHGLQYTKYEELRMLMCYHVRQFLTVVFMEQLTADLQLFVSYCINALPPVLIYEWVRFVVAAGMGLFMAAIKL